MTALDLRDAVSVIGGVLAGEAAALDDLRQELRRAGDWEGLALLRDSVRRAKADLHDVDQAADLDLVATMPQRTCEVDGLGRIIRHLNEAGTWDEWRDADVARAIARRAAGEMGVSIVTWMPELLGAVVGALLASASVRWRTSALVEAGLEPGEFASHKALRPSVQLPKLERASR